MEERNTPQTIIAYAPINIGCKMDNVKFQTIIVDKPQTAVAEEVCELVDTVFFDRKKFGTVESQMRLRNAIKSVLSKLECQKWFILNGCLPKVQEWTSSQFRYNVDDTRRRRIQQLVKEVLQGLKA